MISHTFLAAVLSLFILLNSQLSNPPLGLSGDSKSNEKYELKLIKVGEAHTFKLKPKEAFILKVNTT